jgi:transposase
MSLPTFTTQGSLFSLSSVSSSLFPESDRYRLFAKLVFPRIAAARIQLEVAYSNGAGRTAIEPVLLLGVCLLQYLEGVPDRQAIDMLRYHAGWNFALNRQLGDPLFHATTLTRFRDRLEEHDLAAVGFKAILEGLIESGLVKRRTNQRMDSTHVLGLVSRMSRVECVRESLRMALQEIASAVPAAQCPAAWLTWWERYVENKLDYRASHEVLVNKLLEAGNDAQTLVAWVREQDRLMKGEYVQQLIEVFGQQFVLEADQPLRTRGKGELDSERIQNPHDPDATYSVKGTGRQQIAHIGYKVQIAESVEERPLEPGEPTAGFVVGVVTQQAHRSDEAGAKEMAGEQRSLGLATPPVLYVDGAYVSAEKLVEAKAEGVELMGPAQPGLRRRPEAYSVEDFDVQIEERKVRCPAGVESTQCSRLDGEKGPGVQYRFEWNQGLCRECPLKERCLGAGQKYRTLLVGEHHMELQKRRKEQREPGFKERMKKRNAIEGTHSELVRAHGMRRTRYRGLERVKMGNYFTTAACNIKRWIRRAVWELSKAAEAGESAEAGAIG